MIEAKRKYAPFLTLVLLVLPFSCRKAGPPLPESMESRVRVEAALVRRMDMIDTVRIYGQVRLRQEALLASQFEGRLTDFSLLIGDRINKGERIGTVVPPEREALLQVLDRIEPALRPMLANQIKSIPLYSPMDGVVLEVWRHTGDVLPKGEAILRMGDLRNLDVLGDLPIRFLPLVRKLKFIRAEFVDYPRTPMLLPIKAVGGRVDEAKQTVLVRLGLANPTEELRPGMLVQLSFPGREHEAALVIPREALLEEEGVYSAFVLHGDRVKKCRIAVGIVQGDDVEVLSGLAEGERVVTRKAYSLTDGMKVVVE